MRRGWIVGAAALGCGGCFLFERDERLPKTPEPMRIEAKSLLGI